jgi:hypothetical protein
VRCAPGGSVVVTAGEGDASPDHRPPWERHPVIQVVTAGVVCGSFAVGAVAGGDVRQVAWGCLAVVAGVLTVVLSWLTMRGVIAPPAHVRGAPRNPLVGAVGAVALVILGAMAVAEVSLGDGAEASPLLRVLAVAALLVLAATLVLWPMTASDEWPDRWRPPSHRRPPDEERGA